MPSIEWNKWWNDYAWPEHGDEWDGQAKFCGQPYEAWKRSLENAFMTPRIDPGFTVLELAPGHGRWTDSLLALASHVILADLNPGCIDFLKKKYEERSDVSFMVTDGRSLPGIAAESIDFIWSYDSFVHMEKPVIEAYFREFSRVLRPGRSAIIHHAGRRHLALPFSFIARFGAPGKYLYRLLSMKRDTGGGSDGDRSMISDRLIRRLAERARLSATLQTDAWGEDRRFDCRRFMDTITVLEKGIEDVPADPGSGVSSR